MKADEQAAGSLRHGAEFPFDAPDDWWQGDGTKPPLAGDWAHAAARGVIADLTDRRGVKNGFDGIGQTIRADIVTALANIIRLAAADRKVA